jgi:hypothetical protein
VGVIVQRALAAVLMVLLAGEPLLVDNGVAEREGLAAGAVVVLALGALALVRPHGPLGALFAGALIAEYATALSFGDVPVDPLAPLDGVALLAVLELLDALPARPGRLGLAPVRVDPALRGLRLRRGLIQGATGLVAGALALAATSASSAGNASGLRIVGMAAVALAVAVPVLVARRVVGTLQGRMVGDDER